MLKPRHSAFYATALQPLLETLEVRRIVLAGVASDQCVRVTVMDARIREVQVVDLEKSEGRMTLAERTMGWVYLHFDDVKRARQMAEPTR